MPHGCQLLYIHSLMRIYDLNGFGPKLLMLYIVYCMAATVIFQRPLRYRYRVFCTESMITLKELEWQSTVGGLIDKDSKKQGTHLIIVRRLYQQESAYRWRPAVRAGQTACTTEPQYKQSGICSSIQLRYGTVSSNRYLSTITGTRTSNSNFQSLPKGLIFNIFFYCQN
jgi:hypothetical protein